MGNVSPSEENNVVVALIKKSADWLTTSFRSDRRLFINFLSLGLVQFTNFALPLLTYPYLFRTVGDNKFGAVVYAFNIMIYLTAFTDYGFNLSAPRSVILARGDRNGLSTVVSTVLQVKLCFFLICGFMVTVGILFFDRLQQDSFLYIFGLLYLAGSCTLPTWLFQGLEDMRHITWINLTAKIGSTLLVFIVINQPEDYQYTIGLFGIANLFSGIVGIVYACYKYNLILRWQPISILYDEVISGFYYFLSYFSAVAFSNSTVFILGMFVANDVLGKYGIAEKVVFAIWQLISVFSQATYPVICRLAIGSHQNILEFMRRYYISFTVIIGAMCILTAVFAEGVVLALSGSIQADIVLLLRILCSLPFVVCLNVSAHQLLLVYEKQKANALIFNSSVVINASVCVVLSSNYGAVGAAYSAVFTQIIVTLALHWVLATRYPTHALWATD